MISFALMFESSLSTKNMKRDIKKKMILSVFKFPPEL